MGDNEPVILDYLTKNYGIEGLEPPRRKNLPLRLMGIASAPKTKVAAPAVAATPAKAEATEVAAKQSGETVYNRFVLSVMMQVLQGRLNSVIKPRGNHVLPQAKICY